MPEAVVKRVLASGAHQWIVSVEILEEYELILRRPRFGIAAADVDFWMQAVRSHGQFVDVQTIEPFPRDPKDAKVIACAKTSNADWLITGDRDLLKTPIAWLGRVISVADAAYLLGVSA